jgi:hypothetical protein
VNAPDWLDNVIVAMMLAIAGFFVWRMLAATGWRQRTDYPRDALYTLAAMAVIATQVKSAGDLLPRPAWAVVVHGCRSALRLALGAEARWWLGRGARASVRRRRSGDHGVHVHRRRSALAPERVDGRFHGHGRDVQHGDPALP